MFDVDLRFFHSRFSHTLIQVNRERHYMYMYYNRIIGYMKSFSTVDHQQIMSWVRIHFSAESEPG
eukprot:COSAG02_NODE_14_length_56855_cov_512.793661_45_plen_65_part_00